MSGFFFVPIQMRLVTPEERAQLEKERVAEATSHQRSLLAALPHLRAARQELREVIGLGVGGDRVESIRQSLAVLIDDVETGIMRSL